MLRDDAENGLSQESTQNSAVKDEPNSPGYAVPFEEVIIKEEKGEIFDSGDEDTKAAKGEHASATRQRLARGRAIGAKDFAAELPVDIILEEQTDPFDVEEKTADASSSKTQLYPAEKDRMKKAVEEEEPDGTEAPRDSTAHNRGEKRKRTRKQKEEAKYRRNSGLAYENSKGEITHERRRRAPHKCSIRKCHEIITESAGDAIFSEYWAQQDHDKRVLYVVNRVECCDIKQRRPRSEAEKKHPKSVSYKYYFDLNGQRVQVCKSTFLDTLGETDGFLRTAMMNRGESELGTIHEDRRGRQEPPHKLKEETKVAVLKHIQSFPSYESEDGDVRFLPSDISITKMYKDYQENDRGPKVSYSTYERLFQKSGRKLSRREVGHL